jgi:hypothetical protein
MTFPQPNIWLFGEKKSSWFSQKKQQFFLPIMKEGM